MRNAMVAAVLAAGLVTALAEYFPHGKPAMAQPTAGGPWQSELITHLIPGAGDKHQQMLVLDPKLRVMSVYHVDSLSGVVSLRCVRQIHWDLQLADYNGVNPLPREIRLMLEHP